MKICKEILSLDVLICANYTEQFKDAATSKVQSVVKVVRWKRRDLKHLKTTNKTTSLLSQRFYFVYGFIVVSHTGSKGDSKILHLTVTYTENAQKISQIFNDVEIQKTVCDIHDKLI